MPFITLHKDNIDKEHICCALSDKKCTEGYGMKKNWLKQEFEKGYVFRRINDRAKVMIEYGPAENSWLPIEAAGYLNINCLWVSGQYKGKGYAKALLKTVIDDAREQGKYGLVTVAGTKKLPYMSDPKWLRKQGFISTQQLPYGFTLWTLKFYADAPDPIFKESALIGECPEKEGLVVYYTNRCPFTEFYVKENLKETATRLKLPLTIIKMDTMEVAQNAPSPATIFSLFCNGKFVTSDISVCIESRFHRITGI